MSVDSAWKSLYRAGGASWIFAAILAIVAFASVAPLGPLSSGKGLLDKLTSQILPFRVFVGSFIFSDAFLIPAILALYLSLKELGRNHALVSAVTGLVGAALSIAGFMILYAASGLGIEYSTASNDAQRAPYIAAADLALGAFNASLVISGLLFAVFFILFGLVMLRGVYGKPLGYLGIITGLVTIPGSIPITPLLPLILASAVLTIIWGVAVGWKLYKLG